MQKKRFSIPIKMVFIMIGSILLAGILDKLYQNLSISFIRWLRDICIVTAFQFIVMHLSAPIVFMLFRKKFQYDNFWFRQKTFEPQLYCRLKVKKWKVKMPNYNTGQFSLKDKSYVEVVMNMCHAEVVHELIGIAGFLSLLLTRAGLNVWFLAITSFLFFMAHMGLAIVQRYNRPRILKMMKR